MRENSSVKLLVCYTKLIRWGILHHVVQMNQSCGWTGIQDGIFDIMRYDCPRILIWIGIQDGVFI